MNTKVAVAPFNWVTLLGLPLPTILPPAANVSPKVASVFHPLAGSVSVKLVVVAGWNLMRGELSGIVTL